LVGLQLTNQYHFLDKQDKYKQRQDVGWFYNKEGIITFGTGIVRCKHNRFPTYQYIKTRMDEKSVQILFHSWYEE